MSQTFEIKALRLNQFGPADAELADRLLQRLAGSSGASVLDLAADELGSATRRNMAAVLKALGVLARDYKVIRVKSDDPDDAARYGYKFLVAIASWDQERASAAACGQGRKDLTAEDAKDAEKGEQ